MKNKLQILFHLTVLSLLVGCAPDNSLQNYNLTQNEKKICDTLQIDSTIVHQIRIYNSSVIEPFHYSFSTIIDQLGERETDPMYYPGLRFTEEHKKSDDLILKLKDSFIDKGYTIFLLRNNFNIDNAADDIGVLKTTNKYTILKQIGTDGLNWNISNDSVIAIIKQYDKKYALELIGARGDGCEFIIHNEPKDWTELAGELNKTCPDFVEQGWGKIEDLANEMKKTKRISFWWD